MAVSVGLDNSQYRYDGATPNLFITGVDNIAMIRVSGDRHKKYWTYKTGTNDSNNVVSVINASDPLMTVKVYDAFRPTWVRDTGIILTGSNDLTRNAGTGNDGAYYDTALDSTDCSIEGKTTSIQKTCGISLQNGSTITHDYFEDDEIAHAMLFGQNGRGSILELGSLAPRNGQFQYEAGDKGLIQLTGGYDGGIVRYFLVKSDGRLILLRTTRSKLTSEPKAEVMLYFVDSQLDEIYVHSNDSASAVAEHIGVLDYFQDWRNSYAVASTAEALNFADKQPTFSFANTKKRVRQLSIESKYLPKELRDPFFNFFLYHGIEIPFLFVDRTDRNDPVYTDQRDEFWARFASAYSDVPEANHLFTEAVGIIEDFREDYIPLPDTELAPAVPTIAGEFSIGSDFFEFNIYPSESANGIAYYEYRIGTTSGVYGAPVNIGRDINGAITLVNIPGLTTSTHYYYQIRAIDWANNVSAWSSEYTATTL